MNNRLIENLIDFLPASFRKKYSPLKKEVKIIYGKLTRQILGRPALPKLDNGAINLHVGCGSINHPTLMSARGLPLYEC
ncbi:hypothetical protein [Okeania sp. SIO2B3]|uniref:hypothetical protein n=1 Tax=Okeania sp. SIO2B3 TaxID=2607784 RepID=UPI0013C132CE|nr:hypothetical protein [Okeania sp. SIO2B3]NET44122.1 hypothetical protein [Okeania sp. SIO2B3]